MSDVHAQIDMFDDPVRVRDGELPDSLGDDMLPEQVSTSGAALNVLGDVPPSRAILVQELSRQIPLNEYNLPNYIYRPDLIDPTTLTMLKNQGKLDAVRQVVDSSVVHVSWGQGFPTIEGDTPLWARLPFEPEDAFRAFLTYAELQGVRGIHNVTHEDPKLVGEWYHLYYWQYRARALDLFKAAHHHRLREHRILELEDNHWIEGQRIMKRLQNAIANKSEEDLQALDVDKLISSMERIAKIQRAAVRLPTNGASETEVPKSTSVEVAIRQASEDGTPKRVDNDLDMQIFEDPDILNKAQDLIIKVSHK